VERWTIDSRHPPSPGDGPFYGADLGLFMHATLSVSVLPKTTKQFDQAAKQNPALTDELARLCRSFKAAHLSALADALHESVKNSLNRGPRKKEISGTVVTNIDAMLYAGKEPAKVARAVAPDIASVSEPGQLKRAHREVRRRVGHKPTLQVSYEVALGLWAGKEAARQLEEEISGGIMTEAEAEKQLPGRISEIKSRALSQSGDNLGVGLQEGTDQMSSPPDIELLVVVAALNFLSELLRTFRKRRK
jgi:hypothetical protein